MNKLIDRWGRKINYLRISVTDRCNLRCQYCMPKEGIVEKEHEEILRYEEILKIVKAGVKAGIKKVRVTGGEPLVRIGMVNFIKQLNSIEGLEEISMTTNGVLLSQYAKELKEAGLNRVNISLDTLNREKFYRLTRRDSLDRVFVGIEAALKANLNPVKINVVLMKGINDDEIMDFIDLTRRYPLHIRFIEFMPLGLSKEIGPDVYLSLSEVIEKITVQLTLYPARIKSSGPAKTYQFDGCKGTIGFITPISHSFCGECNRLRLTADGHLRPCLEKDFEIDLHTEKGEIGDFDFLIEKFIEAINFKPDCHDFSNVKENKIGRSMFQIGG